MQFIKALLDAPATLSAASNYTIANGIAYIASGLVLVVWPAAVQWLFLDADFVGHEASLVRVIGLTVGIIGWLYVFGGRSGGHQIVAATVVDRLLFVPVVLVPVALSGTCPHLLVTFLILDPCLALGAWWMLSRKDSSDL
jgi:hypothetical protein